MATNRTEKTIRSKGQWAKIIRDVKARSFTFAYGHDGCFKAREIQSFPFSAIPTWADATLHAAQHMENYGL